MDGQIALDQTLNLSFLITDASSNDVAINSDALPTFKVYDKDVANQTMASGTGTGAFRDSASITGVVDNGSGACRVTSSSHGLQTGDRVTITDVGGATGVNGTHTITKIDSNDFDLDGSTFGGTYTSGGTWNVTGLYYVAIAATEANGYASGEEYAVYVTYAINSGTSTQQLLRFVVY